MYPVEEIMTAIKKIDISILPKVSKKTIRKPKAKIHHEYLITVKIGSIKVNVLE